jgi:predicted AAA+ superfamily ATPase
MIVRLLGSQIGSTRKSILLLGPRQVGKSTLLRQLKPDLTLNLAKENEFLRYSADPQLFFDEIQSAEAKVIFIDEIQRIPSLLNSVQALIDESQGKSELRFLISGSSARKLRRGQANLLPGRVLSYEMSGLCARELGYKVDLAKALKHGFLPEPFLETSSRQAEKLLQSYSAIYLKEEIQAEALSRNIHGFARFLLSIAASSGQVLDFTKIATKAKVSRSSSIRFVEILEDTLIAQRIGCFEGAINADTIKHPKFYFFDVGVLNGLLENFNISEDRKGFLFEHLVYSQIRNSALAHDLPIQINFFRTRHGLEVDFVVQLRDQIWAIEVKSGNASDSDLRSLEAFLDYCPQVHQRVLVTPQEKKRRKNGILICDWMTLLKEMDL